MNTPVLPDADTLVRKAGVAGLAARGVTATVWTLWSEDWAERMPLVVARRVPSGAAPDPRGIDAATISVTTCAADRMLASLLARVFRGVLRDACLSQFADTEAGGYLAGFGEEQAPAELRTGDPAVLHAQVYRFAATYRLITRPLPA